MMQQVCWNQFHEKKSGGFSSLYGIALHWFSMFVLHSIALDSIVLFKRDSVASDSIDLFVWEYRFG